MSKKENLLMRFLTQPSDFKFDELNRLLLDLGYEEVATGKSSGSRVAFYNKYLNDMIKLHKPHPTSIVKRCYLREIAKQLKDKGIIKV
jgi:hypothetical protein